MPDSSTDSTGSASTWATMSSVVMPRSRVWFARATDMNAATSATAATTTASRATSAADRRRAPRAFIRWTSSAKSTRTTGLRTD
jgi:hypothetical protein